VIRQSFSNSLVIGGTNKRVDIDKRANASGFYYRQQQSPNHSAE
jgi:hypothetical protein